MGTEINERFVIFVKTSAIVIDELTGREFFLSKLSKIKDNGDGSASPRRIEVGAKYNARVVLIFDEPLHGIIGFVRLYEKLSNSKHAKTTKK